MSVTPTFMPLADKSRLWGIHVDDAKTLQENERRVLPDLLRLFVACRIPITTWGPVGARKTRTIEALAHEKDENGVNYQVITVQPSAEDPTVIHGIRYTSLDSDTGETIMKRSIPDIAREIVGYNEKTGGLTILFLDEMTTCMPAQQHALLGVLTHGKYGDLDIREHIAIIMAANPPGTVMSVYDLDIQFLNRGGHIPWYGDPSLFLEEWGEGFGHDELKPDPEVEWFISTLLDQNMENAFRSERWKPSELVPYDLIEHSERTTTELARVVELINDALRDSPTSVRHHYIVEATRALQGPQWAHKAAIVCAMEQEKVSGRKAIKSIREHGVEPTWTTEQLQQEVGLDMYEIDTRNGKKRAGQDQINAIADDLIKKIEGKKFNKEAALALWAFAMTAPDEGTIASLHSHLVKLLGLSFDELQEGNIERSEARPEFVTENIRETLRAALQ